MEWRGWGLGVGGGTFAPIELWTPAAYALNAMETHEASFVECGESAMRIDLVQRETRSA